MRSLGFGRTGGSFRGGQPSPASSIAAGLASGRWAAAVVGTGVTFLFYSSQGKEVRRKIVEYFGKGTDDASTNRQETGARA